MTGEMKVMVKDIPTDLCIYAGGQYIHLQKTCIYEIVFDFRESLLDGFLHGKLHWSSRRPGE